jgi:peptidoglycan/xylan/chitin deacetylase (PgdA/CDA1 family)
MGIAKQIFYKGVRLVNLSLLKGLAPQRLLLPYHHLVSDEEVPHIKHLYPYKSVEAFKKDLDYLPRHFKPVSLGDVISGIRNQTPRPEHSFLLTFDDGLREVYETIAPMLYRKGIPAVFFLNSAFVDNKTLFYKFGISLVTEALLRRQHSRATLNALAEALGIRAGAGPEEIIKAVKGVTYANRASVEAAAGLLGISFAGYLAEKKPFMTSEEIRQLAGQGFALGGHSVDHPYYTGLTLEEMLRQTTESVDFVVNTFGLDYRAFAFPHSDAGVPGAFFDRFLDRQAPGLDVIFGTNNQRREVYPQVLHRFNCERPQTAVESAVKGILALNSVQELRGQSVIRRD